MPVDPPKKRARTLGGSLAWVILLTLSIGLGLSTNGSLSAATCDALIDLNVATKMRDGVALRADIFRPREEGKYPVALLRTPYDKAATQAVGCQIAARDYIAVVQDTRGRHSSEGMWYPFRNELLDGYDSVEWAATLSHSNGQLVMTAGSYAGIVQLFAALSQPPHLAGIAPSIIPSNLHEGCVYQGGAFEQLLAETWTSLLAVDSATRRLFFNWIIATPVEQGARLPLSDYHTLDWTGTTDLAPYFVDFLDHPSFDEYWKPWNFGDQANKVQVPGLHIGGWYDIFTKGTLRNYRSIPNWPGRFSSLSSAIRPARHC
jgi:putative CocE/NonD family hydrolase